MCIRDRISPMWLTSKIPARVRTASCSERIPEYSSGISQPPKLTILAPRLRWAAFNAVLRSCVGAGVLTNKISNLWLANHRSMRILECQENRSDGRLLTALQNASCRLGGVILIFTSDGFANMHGGPSVSGPVLCSQCDQPEEKCGCEKYCCYCQSQQLSLIHI